MMMQNALYGITPYGLIEVPEEAIQFSPLIPGSAALESAASATLDSAIVSAPPGSLERRYVLALMLRSLKPGAKLLALAGKDKGGLRLKKELQAFGCNVWEDSRKHFRLCHATRPETPSGIDEAVEAGAPRWVEALGMWSQPGVFSWDRLDAGSALLLKHLPPLRGAGADLGCGIGILARQVLQSPQVESLLLVDADRRAVELAKRNLSDARAAFSWADIREGLEAKPLDFVVMNPPFHESGSEDQTLGQIFIRRARAMLKEGGQCFLVANRHLPYEAVLREMFKEVAVLAEADGYKIFRALA